MLGRSLKHLICLLVVLTAPLCTRAAEFNNLPSIHLTLKSSDPGRPAEEKDSWLISASWIWSYPYEYNLVAAPMIRLEISLPADLQPSNEVQMLPAQVNPLKYFESNEKHIMIVDVPLFSQGIDIDLENHQKKTTLKIRIDTSPGVPSIVIHPSCDDLGIRFSLSPEQGPIINSMPLAITCYKTEIGINVNIQHPHDFTVSTPEGHLRTGRFRHIVEIADQELKATDSVAAPVSICDPQNVCNKILLRSEEFNESSRWALGMRVALSYLTYHQSGQMDMDEFNVDAGVDISYLFPNRGSSIDLSGTTTTSPLSSNSGGNSKAFFHHLYGDLNFPMIDTDENQILISPGYGIESMTAIGQGWGYDGLSGPLVGLTWRRKHVSHAWQIRSAIGLLEEKGGSFDEKNMVFDLAGKILLARRSRSSQLSLVPSYKYLSFQSSQSGKSAILSAFSLGLAIDL